MTEATEFLITCDDVAVFATASEDEVYAWLRWDIDQAVARRSPQMLFVHAGVVGWRGVGIVIPGRGSIGKSTLVAELVRRGAIYYSDTFAVLDDAGRVYRRGPLGLATRVTHKPSVAPRGRLDRAAAIGLIVSGAYTPEVVWWPTVVRGPHAALPLVDSLVLAREQAAQMPPIIAQVAAGAAALRGPRAEAHETAALLLDLFGRRVSQPRARRSRGQPGSPGRRAGARRRDPAAVARRPEGDHSATSSALPRATCEARFPLAGRPSTTASVARSP